MGTPLICDKCGREIAPGSKVEFVSLEDAIAAGKRIIVEDEALVIHKECPK